MRRLLLLFLGVFIAACSSSGGNDDTTPPPPPVGSASLVSLSISGTDLDPTFSSSVTDYTAAMGFVTKSTEVTATAENGNASISVNGIAVASGVASDPVALDEGGNTITVNVTSEDGTTTQSYTVEVTRQSASAFVQTAYVKASNTGRSDDFGRSVALSGDGATMAVGAHQESSAATGANGNETDDTATFSGAVYVFTRDGTGLWAQQAYIKASNTGSGDRFGNAVALSDDGTTLAIGAPREDSTATGVNGNEADDTASYAGAAYVFTRDSGGVWAQQAYLKASNTAAEDVFGYSVALSGDGATLAVGARGEDSAATGVNGDQTDNTAENAGAVYVFTRDSGGTWTQSTYLKASNTGSGDRFGNAVALSGDGTTLAVGAYWEDSAATGVNGEETDNTANDAGAVYVFARDGGDVWAQQAYIKASNTGSGDHFGFSVALSGDGATLAAGAYGENSAATGINGDQTDNTANNAGAVYVFTRDGGGIWTQSTYLKASNMDMADLFGYSVALSDDGRVLAMGSPAEDSPASGVNPDETGNSITSFSTGAAYVFTRDSAGVWAQRAYVKASNPDGEEFPDVYGGDLFGLVIALSGHGATLAVSTLYEQSAATGINGDQADNSYTEAGAAYVFEL